jgi:DNA-binding MarR family transcriptional regulator
MEPPQESTAAAFVHELERLVVLYHKIRGHIDTISVENFQFSYPSASRVCLLRWALSGDIENAEVLRRTGWQDKVLSNQLKELITRDLVVSVATKRDRRKRVLRSGEKTKEILSTMAEVADEALKHSEPELYRQSKALMSALRRVTSELDKKTPS